MSGPLSAPGSGGPVEGADGSNGGAGTAGGAGGGGRATGPGFDFLLPAVVLMIVVMLVFSWMGQRRDRKKRDQMLSQLRKHDQVQTIGGILGSVVDVNDDQVVLKVDESSNIRMTFARSAIQQVIGGGDGKEKD